MLDAVESGDVEELAELIRQDPGFKVNVAVDGNGSTLLHYACNGHTSCAREMLKDSRVKVNEPDDDGYTPLCWAAYHGRLDVIK